MAMCHFIWMTKVGRGLNTYKWAQQKSLTKI